MLARRSTARLAGACLTLLLGAITAAVAQNVPPVPPGPDHLVPPKTGGELQSELGSRAQLSPQLLPAVLHAAVNVDAALRSGTFRTAQGPALTPEVQGTVHALLTGDKKATGQMKAALLEPRNRRAKLEAKALAEAARGLLATPERLPAALEAHNSLVMASSAEFLRNPSEEFLTLHAVLHELAEAAIEAEAPDEEQKAPPVRGAL